MVVDLIDGIEQDIELSTSSKIAFNADSIILTPRTGNNTTQVYSITNVCKISFFESVITEIDTEKQPKIMVYTNPVADYLVIEGLGGEDLLITVYSLNGSVVIRGQFRYGSPIDVSSMSPGPYLIQVGGDNCKFVKK